MFVLRVRFCSFCMRGGLVIACWSFCCICFFYDLCACVCMFIVRLCLRYIAFCDCAVSLLLLLFGVCDCLAYDFVLLRI